MNPGTRGAISVAITLLMLIAIGSQLGIAIYLVGLQKGKSLP